MAQDDLQWDISALNDFAKDLQHGGKSGSGLAGDIAALLNSHQNLDQANFGQFETDNHTLTGFTDAFNLHKAYVGRYGDLIAGPNSSFNTFITQLNALADAASSIAQRYQAAGNEDAVQWQDVDSLLNNPPSPSQPG